MSIIDEFCQSKIFIEGLSILRPKTLIILGSGLGDFAKFVKNPVIVSYSDIPFFVQKSIEGQSGELVIGLIGQHPVYIMKGRNHYYQGLTDEEMRYPIQMFKYLGVNNLIITNACGGMNPSFKPGDIMIIEDHINMMGRNPLIGDNVDIIGPRFSDMSEPYSLLWIEKIEEIAKSYEIHLKKGVYVGYFGPSYETRSEILAYRQLGGDVVGMSTVPEVIVASHAGMQVLGLSVITNMATGISMNKLSHDEVLKTSLEAMDKVSLLILKFIAFLE
ncbi:MAG: purine-nucleoside phosphorylase [Candidatus Izemoplasmatales bacterium]|jgi:purine-nucleoside phosphorylase|nr:purine-nucleoside phosphorylase [Candidatus Izemoplasmatales bacterium]